MDQNANQINADTSVLIETSLNAVKKKLSEFHEFAPYALCIALQGETTPFEIETDNDKLPSKELLAKYQGILDARLSNKQIRAYSIAYDMVVSTTKNNVVENTKAISIKIKHTDPVKRSYYFYAYSFSPDKELVMGHSWDVSM